MRLRPLALLLPLVLVPATLEAAPTALFTWRLETLAGCYQVETDQYTEDGTWLGVGVDGLAEPDVAYAASIDVIPQDGVPLPPAWRFDPAGCETPARVSWKTHPSPGSPCGWLFDMSADPPPSTSITLDAGANVLHLEYAIAVPAPANPFPTDEALVTIVRFDVGGDCAGAGNPLCFHLRSLRFQRPDGSWFEADRPTPVITLNAASFDGPAGCAAVPARPATWGALKGSYR
jgi:hypothetical protein